MEHCKPLLNDSAMTAEELQGQKQPLCRMCSSSLEQTPCMVHQTMLGGTSTGVPYVCWGRRKILPSQPAPDGMAGALLPPDLGQALCYNPNGFCNYTCEGQASRQSVCVCESTERKGISVHLCLSPRVCRMMKFADSAQ